MKNEEKPKRKGRVLARILAEDLSKITGGMRAQDNTDWSSTAYCCTGDERSDRAEDPDADKGTSSLL